MRFQHILLLQLLMAYYKHINIHNTSIPIHIWMLLLHFKIYKCCYTNTDTYTNVLFNEYQFPYPYLFSISSVLPILPHPLLHVLLIFLFHLCLLLILFILISFLHHHLQLIFLCLHHFNPLPLLIPLILFLLPLVLCSYSSSTSSIPPLNTHPMLTKSKIGHLKPKALLTHIEPSNVRVACCNARRICNTS